MTATGRFWRRRFLPMAIQAAHPIQIPPSPMFPKPREPWVEYFGTMFSEIGVLLQPVRRKPVRLDPRQVTQGAPDPHAPEPTS